MNLAAQAALAGDLANALVASMPGGIERQEAEGQRTLIQNTMLPKDISGATREQLTAIGFKFGSDVDDLFVHCELPAGWTKRATDHSMHSDLLDEQGRRRAGIFYKAAFYDRRAFMSMRARYSIDAYSDGLQQNCSVVRAMDGESVLKDFGEYECSQEGYRRGDELQRDAEAWLTAQFPMWTDALAHWD